MDLSSPVVVAALLTAVGVVSSGVVAAIATVLVQMFNRKLEAIRSDLAIKKTEHDARIEYEFYARKRLYEICAPFIFQGQLALSELQSRVCGITALSLKANEPDKRAILEADYYSLNTVYRIFRVSSVIDIIRTALTFEDFRIDDNISYRMILLHVFDDLMAFQPDLGRAGLKGVQLRSLPQGIDSLTKGQCDLITASVIRPDHKMTRSWGEFEQHVTGSLSHGNTFEAIVKLRSTIKGFRHRDNRSFWRLCFGYFVIGEFYRVSAVVPFEEVLSQFKRDVKLFLADGSALKFSSEENLDLKCAFEYVASRIEITRRLFGVPSE